MAAFVEIEEAESFGRYRLRVIPEICVGPPDGQFLFGGAGLAASVAAMERTCGQPLVWATAQYLAFTRPGEIVDVDVTTLATSRYTSQVALVARSKGEVLFRASGALGARSTSAAQQWAAAPSVPAPQDCPIGHHWRGEMGGLHSRLEVRVAKGRYGNDRAGHPEPDGRLLVWVRPTEPADIDAAFLAVIADLLPNGVGNALGRNAGGNSLDNTLRVLELRPTQWILAEIAIHGMGSGFAHGEVRIFSDDGRLLAVASQSLVVRLRD